MESTLEKKNRYEDDAEAECNDLKRISRECEGWVWASDVLLKQVGLLTLMMKRYGF